MKANVTRRLDALEQATGTGAECVPASADELAAWLDGERADYLRRGYLVESPHGLELGAVPSPAGRENSIACLIMAIEEAAPA